MIKYPLVYVCWQDISQSDVAWQSVDEAMAWADDEKTIVHQVGFQLDKTEEFLLITEAIFEDNITIGSVTKIPMSVIQEPIRYIKV